MLICVQQTLKFNSSVKLNMQLFVCNSYYIFWCRLDLLNKTQSGTLKILVQNAY